MTAVLKWADGGALRAALALTLGAGPLTFVLALAAVFITLLWHELGHLGAGRLHWGGPLKLLGGCWR